ncbi:MAG: aminopeptidase P family N-terminal domain-containing protein [Bryobacteraceae bacterium]|nr:aminopeptidase P family N-terminal domain-containing protein [Bryobacteraceae bacterium]
MQMNTDTYQKRIADVQAAMKEFGLAAIVIEPGAAMQHLTGVRWGRSERSFLVVIPAQGAPAFVVPGFEEERARELTPKGADIRVWQEDESPSERVARIFADRGVVSGRVGMEESLRFFIFQNLRRAAPKFEYVTAQPALKSAGVNLVAPPRSRP